MIRTCIVFVALLAGCDKPLVVQLVKDVSSSVAVDVAGKPGATVWCAANGLDLSELRGTAVSAVVAPGGHAQLTIKSEPTQTRVEISCSAKRGTEPATLTFRRPVRALVDKSGGIKLYGRSDEYDQCQGSLEWHANTVDVTMIHCRPGTVLTSGGKSVTASPKVLFQEVKLSAAHDLAGKLPQLAVEELVQPEAAPVVPLLLSLRFPDGDETNVSSSGGAYRLVAFEVLSRLRQGPVLFPGETARAGDQSLLILGPAFAEARGNAKRLVDVDRVALLTWNKRVIDCGEYRDTTSGRVTRGTAQINDLDVAVYDRRTGKRLGQQRFKAQDGGCKQTVSSRHNGPELSAGGGGGIANLNDGIAFAASFHRAP